MEGVKGGKEGGSEERMKDKLYFILTLKNSHD